MKKVRDGVAYHKFLAAECKIIGRLDEKAVAKIVESQRPAKPRKPSYKARVRNGRFVIG